jgi:hypothetical protein
MDQKIQLMKLNPVLNKIKHQTAARIKQLGADEVRVTRLIEAQLGANQSQTPINRSVEAQLSADRSQDTPRPLEETAGC